MQTTKLLIATLALFTSCTNSPQPKAEPQPSSGESTDVAGSAVEPPRTEPLLDTLSPNDGVGSHALSLTRLQYELERQNPAARRLGGLNRILAVAVETTDIILFGNLDLQAPTIHIDDLTVALRNAMKVPGYEGTPGVTIDPREGVGDPYSIQTVRIFGMPECRMTARFVDLDYELKSVGAGLLTLDGVQSPFAMMAARNPCASESSSAGGHHRFWFFPKTPEGPRYQRDGRRVRIREPVGVQLLTEQEFRSSTGVREGVAKPTKEATEYAANVTRMLSETPPERYQQLVGDFRLIEVAKLLDYLGAPKSRLDYLLNTHRIEMVDVPEQVPGVWREASSRTQCSAQLVAQAGGVGLRENIREHTVKYRGGVDAEVETPPASFESKPGSVEPHVITALHKMPSSPTAFLWSF